jgi:hypothetical protein
MEKRYQVFISSTFQDLQNARQEVSQALLRADCFPAGMELFPAVDEEQFEFIKTIIDQSDYYIIISAGRYGTVHQKTGLSYTEMEYDYAVKKGKPVIRLLHKDPFNELKGAFIEKTAKGRRALERFRKKLTKKSLVKFWDTAETLQLEVTLALREAQKGTPVLGWVRPESILNSEMAAPSSPKLTYEDLEKIGNVIQEFFDTIGIHIVFFVPIGDGDERIGPIFDDDIHGDELCYKILKFAYFESSIGRSMVLEDFVNDLADYDNAILDYNYFVERYSDDVEAWVAIERSKGNLAPTVSESEAIIHVEKLLKVKTRREEFREIISEDLFVSCSEEFIILDMYKTNDSLYKALEFLSSLDLITLRNNPYIERYSTEIQITQAGIQISQLHNSGAQLL